MAKSGWTSIIDGQSGQVVSNKYDAAFENIDESIEDVEGMVDGSFLFPFVGFEHLDATPAYQEGLIWYDNKRKALAYFDDVSSDPIHIGQELLIHAFNGSGATIPAGTVVRYDGTVSGGFPGIVPAQADLVANARAIGITSTDMPNNSTGSIMREGTLEGIDTTALTSGRRQYLSATVAGAMTETAPTLACLVGAPVTNDVSGVFFVSIDNFRSLPNGYIEMKGGSAPATIGAAWEDISNYNTEMSAILTGNLVTGEILAPLSGTYTLIVNCAMSHNSTGGDRPAISLRLVGDQGYVGDPLTAHAARDSEGTAFYPTSMGMLVVGENYKLQISSTDDLTNVSFDTMSFQIETKNLDLT